MRIDIDVESYIEAGVVHPERTKLSLDHLTNTRGNFLPLLRQCDCRFRKARSCLGNSLLQAGDRAFEVGGKFVCLSDGSPMLDHRLQRSPVFAFESFDRHRDRKSTRLNSSHVAISY